MCIFVHFTSLIRTILLFRLWCVCALYVYGFYCLLLLLSHTIHSIEPSGETIYTKHKKEEEREKKRFYGICLCVNTFPTAHNNNKKTTKIIVMYSCWQNIYTFVRRFLSERDTRKYNPVTEIHTNAYVRQKCTQRPHIYRCTRKRIPITHGERENHSYMTQRFTLGPEMIAIYRPFVASCHTAWVWDWMENQKIPLHFLKSFRPENRRFSVARNFQVLRTILVNFP